MNIVIIEDEKITADDLAGTIQSVEPDAVIVAILGSVKAAIDYLGKNDPPDLIFSDVQLGDGLSFEIFKAVKIITPVIFCTAYDDYALNAFKANSIDYILKPFSSKSLAEAMTKYHNMHKAFAGSDNHYKAIIEALAGRDKVKPVSVLVHHKDKILPIRFEDIALFYIENEITYLLTFPGPVYTVPRGLEELEQLAGERFFRVNRQFLINRKAVIDASHYFARKLSVNITVPFNEKITVSKEKTPSFLSWLENVNG